MKITYYGHSCFGIQIGQSNILIDPYISGNPHAASIAVDDIQADYIFLSHGHTDHVLDAEHIALQKDSMIISNYEVTQWYQKKGLKTHALNIGGTITLSFGRAKMVVAVHSSSMPDGTYGGIAGGFVFETTEGNFYFAGDTALTEDMKLIPIIAGPLDFAILPIGDNFTMGIQDAVHAARFIGCSNIFGCHYDTFPPIEINQEDAITAFYSHNCQLTLLKIGESFDFVEESK